MGVETIVTSIALVGGFVVGLWYIFTRKDVSISARQGMNPEGLRYGSGAPGFGSAKKEIDRKLALVENRRRRQEAISSRMAVENAERLAREQLQHSRAQQKFLLNQLVHLLQYLELCHVSLSMEVQSAFQHHLDCLQVCINLAIAKTFLDLCCLPSRSSSFHQSNPFA